LCQPKLLRERSNQHLSVAEYDLTALPQLGSATEKAERVESERECLAVRPLMERSEAIARDWDANAICGRRLALSVEIW
jgi:hypothetical protein